MRGSQQDLPVSFDGDGVRSQQVEWGEMNVALESFPAALDTAPLFKGLPDDRCQCPHWGYVLKGRFRIKYANHEEVLGEAMCIIWRRDILSSSKRTARSSSSAPGESISRQWKSRNAIWLLCMSLLKQR